MNGNVQENEIKDQIYVNLLMEMFNIDWRKLEESLSPLSTRYMMQEYEALSAYLNNSQAGTFLLIWKK